MNDDRPHDDAPPGVNVFTDPNIIPIASRMQEKKKPGPRGPVRALHFADDASSEQHIEWLIKTIMPTQGVAMLGGVTATGKTYVAMDLALSVILGEGFNGHLVKHPGAVLWFAAEGAPYLLPRWFALRKAKAVPFFAQRGIEPSTRLPFLFVDDVPKLTDFHGLGSIISTAHLAMAQLKEADVKLRLIVIDTFSASTVFADANSAAEAAKAIDALKMLNDETGAMVLAIDHFGKNPEAGLRGSSAKEAGIDVLLQINGERGQTEGLELEVAKVRGGMVGLKLPFSLKLVEQGVDEDGDEITERIVDWGGERQSLKPTARQPRSVQMLVRAICDLEPEGKTNPRGDIWVRAVEEVRLREEFYKRYTAAGDESHRNAKYNAFRRAIELGLHSRVLDKQEYPDDRSLVWVVAHVTNAANASSDAVEQ